MLLRNPASVLLRWDRERRRKLHSGDYFERVRKRFAVCRKQKDLSPMARLGAIVRTVVGPLALADPGDPNLLSLVETRLRESGDLEVWQLVKEYLAEV